MNYGENSHLVEEVIIVASTLKLAFSEKIPIRNFSITHDYEEAQELAWSQDSEIVDTVWESVKAFESGEILGILYEENITHIEKSLRELFHSSKGYPDNFVLDYIDIFEEITEDLLQCALNRLIYGETDNFFERVFQVYKQGGWPCGWDGTYPDGRMFIYIPKEKECS